MEDTAVSPQDTIGVVEDDAKVCASCKHLIGVRYNTGEAEERWKCGHKNNTQEWKNNLVTGLKYRIFVITEIKRTRYEHCKGDWYEEYLLPVKEPTIGGLEAKELTEIVFDPDAIKRNREAAAKVIEERRQNKNKLSGLKASDL